ncbi:MAG: methyltransferase domain-containing protein [Candidatus Micrarchaeia archaeon]
MLLMFSAVECKGKQITSVTSRSTSQREVWDKIATGWTNWRQKSDPVAERLAAKWPPGKLLDIGCGNCRNLKPFVQMGFECHGVDFSPKMIDIAKQFCRKNSMKVNLQVADADSLPFKPSSFNYVLSIAILHHLETKEKRLKAVQEIKRVLKPGGKAFISVWNKLQWKFVFKPQDMFVPWQRKGIKYMRYYHFFHHWELLRLIKSTGLKIEWFSGPFGRNLQFIVEKR